MLLPQFDDQGLVNTDPRTIALPDGFFNSMPTDIHGITFNRTPKMVCSLLRLAVQWSFLCIRLADAAMLL